MIIVGIVVPPAMALMQQTILRMHYFIDEKIAMLRIAKAESTLKPAVFYCGYGMPGESKLYRKAFGKQGTEPFNWAGPIVVRPYSGRADAELCIAYGYPSGVLSYYSYVINGALADIAVQKEFSGGLVAAYDNQPKEVKNWILFSSVRPPNTPLAVKQLKGRSVKVSSGAESFRLDEGDEAHYFRAVIYHCNGETLYSKDFRTTGVQPRTEGIVDMRFQLDKATGTLTVIILARGGIRSDTGPEIRGAEKWPAEYGAVPATGPYRYYIEKIIWRIPNYQSQ